jgi:hypothetical protein
LRHVGHQKLEAQQILASLGSSGELLCSRSSFEVGNLGMGSLLSLQGCKIFTQDHRHSSYILFRVMLEGQPFSFPKALQGGPVETLTAS